MRIIFIVIISLNSAFSFASIDDLLQSLPAAISKSHVEIAERIILQNPRANLYWDLGMSEHHRIAFMRQYKTLVESRYGRKCIPLAKLSFSTPLGMTIDKILEKTEELCH
jgi:hypothetical protein